MSSVASQNGRTSTKKRKAPRPNFQAASRQPSKLFDSALADAGTASPPKLCAELSLVGCMSTGAVAQHWSHETIITCARIRINFMHCICTLHQARTHQFYCFVRSYTCALCPFLWLFFPQPFAGLDWIFFPPCPTKFTAELMQAMLEA